MSDNEELQKTNAMLTRRAMEALEESDLMARMLVRLAIEKSELRSLAERYQAALLQIVDHDQVEDAREIARKALEQLCSPQAAI